MRIPFEILTMLIALDVALALAGGLLKIDPAFTLCALGVAMIVGHDEAARHSL